jgi:hypothetical protein
MSGVATLSYVYAVTRAETPVPDDVDVVVHRDLAAITAPADERRLRARRRDLLRHAEIVQSVFDRGTVVPLQFGIVVDDVVADVLEPRYDELSRLLRELDGLAEVTLRAYYREEDVLRALLAADPRLARLRENAAPMQLGEAVAHALAAQRAADADAIVRALRPHAVDVALDEPRTDLEIFRGAFLVRRDALDAIDGAAGALAGARADTTVFKYAGPLPPHHFVRMGAA